MVAQIRYKQIIQKNLAEHQIRKDIKRSAYIYTLTCRQLQNFIFLDTVNVNTAQRKQNQTNAQKITCGGATNTRCVVTSLSILAIGPNVEVKLR